MYATASADGSFRLVDVTNGHARTMTHEEFDALMHAQAPQIEETPDALHDECLALLTSALFHNTNVHPLKLDGKEIPPVRGGSPGLEHLHYIDGHTLETNGTKRTYTS